MTTRRILSLTTKHFCVGLKDFLNDDDNYALICNNLKKNPVYIEFGGFTHTIQNIKQLNKLKTDLNEI